MDGYESVSYSEWPVMCARVLVGEGRFFVILSCHCRKIQRDHIYNIHRDRQIGGHSHRVIKHSSSSSSSIPNISCSLTPDLPVTSATPWPLVALKKHGLGGLKHHSEKEWISVEISEKRQRRAELNPRERDKENVGDGKAILTEGAKEKGKRLLKKTKHT